MPEPISLNALLLDFHILKTNHVPYIWGAKPDPDTEPDMVTGSDCSGFCRYLMARRVGNALPLSSIEQRDWFNSNGYEAKEYANILQYCNHDGGRLFVAGFALGGTRRHIYFVLAGATMECGSSIHGVGSRPATDFASETQWACEIPITFPGQ